MLNRITYWLKAQGRHGTHSPFVYAFVEQVLRSNGKIMNRSFLKGFNTLKAKEWQLLLKTILYLNPNQICCSKNIAPELQILLGKLSMDKVNIATEPTNINYAEPMLWIVTSANVSVEKVVSIWQKHVIDIIVLSPNKMSNNSFWQQLCNSKICKLQLNFWHWGFLSNHPKFKAVQHFWLK